MSVGQALACMLGQKAAHTFTEVLSAVELVEASAELLTTAIAGKEKNPRGFESMSAQWAP